MVSFISFYRKFVILLNQINGAVCALAIVCSALIVTEGILVRKLFGISTIWQIEASVILLIFATFVGAAHAQLTERHLNVDLLIIHFDPRVREWVLIFAALLTCCICGILAFYAWPMWWEAFIRNDHSESLWAPPLWIPYFFIPFGMSLLFLQYTVYIGEKILVLRAKTPSN